MHAILGNPWRFVLAAKLWTWSAFAPRARGTWTALALLLALAAPCPALAQIVQGRLRDAASQAPVQGALVLLLSADGRQVGGFLTDEGGAYRLRAPEPGRYTLRAERIGFETVTSDAFELSAGPALRVDLEAAGMAVALEGIRVEGQKRCVVRPGEGQALARVWDEAQKALRNQEWTDQSGLVRFRLERYEREMDPASRVVISESRTRSVWTGRNPIRSLPVEDLLEKGFILQTGDGGYTYLGPDAAVLLSEAFLETHCFSLEADENDPGLIGLGFEPLRRRNVADIHGTLWLGRADARLRFLEFGYTTSPWPEVGRVANGRVEFDEVPGGAWVIRRWWIRMPKVVRDFGMMNRGRSGLRVAGIVEAGGTATQVDVLRAAVANDARSGRVRGVVWDSIRARPLRGAEVYISAVSLSAVTDSAGRFTMDGVPEGAYEVAFRHPRLDSLPVYRSGVEVSVGAGATSDVTLGVPSLSSIFGAICSDEERTGGASAVVGVVRTAGDGSPVSGASVSLEWTNFRVVGGREVQGDVRTVRVTTDARGRYSACGMPPGVLLTARASLAAWKSGVRSAEVPREDVVVLDLTLPHTHRP